MQKGKKKKKKKKNHENKSLQAERKIKFHLMLLHKGLADLNYQDGRLVVDGCNSLRAKHWFVFSWFPTHSGTSQFSSKYNAYTRA